MSAVHGETLPDLGELVGTSCLASQPWLTEVTADAIRHFAISTADLNQRWSDPDAGIAHVAPPLFPLAAMSLDFEDGFDAIPLTWKQIAFYPSRELLPGDEISPRGTVTEVVATPAGLPELSLEVDFADGSGASVASCQLTLQAEVHSGSVPSREPFNYTPETVAEVEQTMFTETPAVASPQLSDLVVGTELPRIVRGPLNHFDIAFLHAALGWTWTVGNSEDRWERSYFEDDTAHAMGLPAASAPASILLVWASTLVTSWMGPDARFVGIRGEFLGRPAMGDVVWFSGSVETVSPEGETTVEIAGTDQFGDILFRGSADIALSRASSL
jgi:hypothetical protein